MTWLDVNDDDDHNDDNNDDDFDDDICRKWNVWKL